MRLRITAIVIGLATAAFAMAADDLAPVKEAAVRLYDQGNYEDAQKALQDLDNARVLDGPSLYRLFFCQKATGHDDDARKALDRARQALETEILAKNSLEVAFYLANTYSNLGRATDARKVAHGLTAAIESGGIAAPTNAIGLFQLGKLYQDQDRQSEASSSYAKAVDGFDLAEGRYAGNARWALRYLGKSSFSRGEFASAEKSFARLTSLGGAEAADWDALAEARARLARYAPAADAWRSSVKLDQANGDDSRYAARLADTAAVIAPLPAAAPGAVAFAAMGQTDLESFLKARAAATVAAEGRAAEASQPGPEGQPTRALDPKLRAELAETLRQTRREFVAAALEYALRRYGIRDTAFREGYAVLIFQDRAWELPADPEPAAKDPSESGS